MIIFKDSRPIKISMVNQIFKDTPMDTRILKILKWISNRTRKTLELCSKWIDSHSQDSSTLTTSNIQATLRIIRDSNSTQINNTVDTKISTSSTLNQLCKQSRPFSPASSQRTRLWTWMWFLAKNTWNNLIAISPNSTQTCLENFWSKQALIPQTRDFTKWSQ